MKKDKTIFYSVYAFIIIILILFLMITFGAAYYAETTGEELYTTIIILSATALLVVAAILALKIESLIEFSWEKEKKKKEGLKTIEKDRAKFEEFMKSGALKLNENNNTKQK